MAGSGSRAMGMMIVTGASRGIGAAVARLAGARGYAVAVNYHRSPDAAEAVVRDITAAGGRARAIKADVARESEILRLFDEATRELGPLTALVNNAGITGGSGRAADVAVETLDEVFRLNVIGAILCAREAIRRMSTAMGGQGGAIVNISSVAAVLGAPGEYVHYAASKGAIDSLTVGLAKELAGEGIRVNAVAPGLIDTEIHEPGRLDRIVPMVPMKRVGTAEEVAEAVLYLLSDAASYVTGTVLRVSGGR